MKETYITYKSIKDLLKDLSSKENTEVFAPVIKDGSPYITKINRETEIALDYFITVNSIKEALFPRYEPILKYTVSKDEVKLIDPEVDKKIIIFGGHPCDAASMPLMDKLFSWDYNDKFFLKRRENSLIITIACEEFDKYCFCTTVGNSPRGERGSDILFERVSNEAFRVKSISESGKKFIEENKSFFVQEVNIDKNFPKITDKDIKVKFDKNKVKKWIEENFEDPLWKKMTENCWSCAACTFVCPTCHCFDITDNASMWKGIRTKNWDACTLPVFTLHASGHNPRELYFQRYRQRIAHKYSYYVDLFSDVSCTGCGRCSRVCGAGINISEVLSTISSANSSLETAKKD
mgnify:FL=1